MKQILVFLTNFYWPLLPQVAAESLWHADWQEGRRTGIWGFLVTCWRSLLGINCAYFFIPMDSSWSGHNVKRLLARNGVKMWGWSYANGEFFFRVRLQEAVWAEMIMLNAGVPLIACWRP